MEDLKISIVQTKLFWEEKKKNLEMFDAILKDVEETDLIILPEMFSTGFTMNAQKCSESPEGPSINWMQKISREKNCVVTGSVIVKESEKFYNRLIWMEPDRYDSYNKRHLFSLAKEDETYTAGDKKIIKVIKGWKVLPLVCYDLRFPVWSRRTEKENYDLLIYVANWPERRIYAWQQLLIARAIENQSYVAGVNRIGDDGNEYYHSGESAVIDFTGAKISGVSKGNEFVQTITLKFEELQHFRSQFAFFEDRDDFRIL